jgi:hypothetical protein
MIPAVRHALARRSPNSNTPTSENVSDPQNPQPAAPHNGWDTAGVTYYTAAQTVRDTGARDGDILDVIYSPIADEVRGQYFSSFGTGDRVQESLGSRV